MFVKFLVPCALISLLAALVPASANVATVQLTAPATAGPSGQVTLEMEISHLNSDPGHYVDWVRLYKNGELLRDWSFNSTNYVGDNKWTLTYATTIEGETTFRAEAHCNLHGGRDDVATVEIEGENGAGGNGGKAYLLVAVAVPVLLLTILFLKKR